MSTCDCKCTLHGKSPCPCECPNHRDDTLTLAQALALCRRRGVVEIQEHGGDWQEFFIDTGPVDTCGVELKLIERWAASKFRRSRPKRSRVQEMAQAKWTSPDWLVCDRQARESTIRAVCEWLRSHPTDRLEGREMAPYIEHEFLEPR